MVLPILTPDRLQRQPSAPVLSDRPLQLGAGALQAHRPLLGPHQSSLAYDRLFWGPAEQRIAAAVLGHQAAHRMGMLIALRAYPERGESRYAQGIDWEVEHSAVELAREAAHYALCALEAEEAAAGSIDGSTR
jgi:hypothetical protein